MGDSMSTETPEAAAEAIVAFLVATEDFDWQVFAEASVPASEIMAIKAASLEGKRRLAAGVLEALRALPVAQRAAAIGLIEVIHDSPTQWYLADESASLFPDRFWTGSSDDGDKGV